MISHTTWNREIAAGKTITFGFTGDGSVTTKPQNYELDGFTFDSLSIHESIYTTENPDLAVEVVFSSGGVKDLEKYKALNVKEVWFWENNKLNIYLNTNSNYTELFYSSYLPKISRELLSKYINKGFILDNLTIQNEFVKELQNL